MKKILFNSVFLLLHCFHNDISAQNFDLKNYVWHKRVLLVFAPNDENKLFKQQILTVKTDEKGFEDRNLVVISLFNRSGFDEKDRPLSIQKVEALRRQYKISEKEFRAILIGKDGGKKESSAQPFKNQQLFKTIDAMPMRKNEIKTGLE